MINKNNNSLQKSDIVQWFDKQTDRYVKFNRLTGEQICQKVTAGPYKNVHVAKRRPRRRSQPIHKTPDPINYTKKQQVKKGNNDKKNKKPRKRNYLNNRDLLEQVLISKKQMKMTDKLAHMLQTLCARYARRGQYANYTYNDDMQAYAMMMLVRTWNSFNPEKSQNPFAFFTQCVKHSFIQYLKQERRQRDIRDALLVDVGLDPSFTYQEAQKEEENNNTQTPTK